jgi:integrase
VSKEEERLEDRLKQVNIRLKAARMGAAVFRKGRRLYLRATLPPKPGIDRDRPYQQDVSLGIYASDEGIKQSEVEAKVLSSHLAKGTFLWADWLRGPQQLPETVRQWVVKFESDFFNRRARTPESIQTWRCDYLSVYKKLPQDQKLTAGILKALINTTPPDTKTRRRTYDALKRLAKFAELELPIDGLGGSYSPSKTVPRDLPSDELIVREWKRLRGKLKREDSLLWLNAYAILATYGIRPHELFHLDLSGLKENSGIISVGHHTKTGSRTAYPFHPEWVERFELWKAELPKSEAWCNSNKGNLASAWFLTHGVPFPPYNLRHAYAVRQILYGLDLSVAAQMMGHSVKQHTDTYHRWITDTQQKQAFEMAIKRIDRPIAP